MDNSSPEKEFPLSKSNQAAVDALPKVIWGIPLDDPRLGEATEDTLRFFSEYASSIREVSLLQKIASGQADIYTWIRYIVPRLQDANLPVKNDSDLTLFETFLQSTAQAAGRHGLHDAEKALWENFNEERGIINGVRQEKESHATWRREFRDRMFALLRERGATAGDLRKRPITTASEGYESYIRMLMRENERDTEKPWHQLGAITMLELCLREEFQCICAGLQRTFPELSIQDARYIHHHAGHEERHFAELFEGVIRSIELQDIRERIMATQGILNGGAQLSWSKRDVLNSY